MDLFDDDLLDQSSPDAHHYSDAGGESMRDEALTRQLRNLLLLLPLFQLELGKARLGPNEVDLFEGIDTLYLCLSLFDFISGRMVIDVGAERAEVLEHLDAEMLRIGSPLQAALRRQGAEQVLDALSNARERHRAFSLPYFDAGRGGEYRREFRLLQYREQSAGGYRYVLTPEGITAYLAMLDVEPKLMQQAEEILIQRLMDRGRFRDALSLARRARTRTLDLRETLERQLFQARRAGGSVDWAGDTLPRIDEALVHIGERQQQEAAILQAVSGQDLEQLAEQARIDLVALRETVKDCQYQHTNLHHEVMGINDRYLEVQGNVFRARQRSALPDLEQDILTPLLGRTLEQLTEQAAAITAQLNPARLPKLFDPLLLVELIGQQSHPPEDAGVPEQSDSLQPLHGQADHFPQTLVAEMADYLKQRVAEQSPLTLSRLLVRAEADGLDRDARLCLIYLAIGAYNPKDDYIGLKVEPGGPLDHPLVSGTELNLELPTEKLPDG